LKPTLAGKADAPSVGSGAPVVETMKLKL